MATNPMDSAGKPCFYCGKPIAGPSASSLHLDLGVAFFHADGSGKLRWHHNSCLLKKLGEIKTEPMPVEDILEQCKNNPLCEHGYPKVPLFNKDHLVCRKYVGLPEPQPSPFVKEETVKI
jgi:hypothetical protein